MNRMQRRHFLRLGWIMVCIHVLCSACSDSSNDITDTASQKCTTTSGAGLVDSDDSGVKKVTFYRDLLPILTANTRQRPYKCTTCHAHYETPEGLSNVPEVERIVDSLNKGRMPRSNSRVSEDEIKLFESWRLQGFLPGDPKDAPKVNTNSASKSTGKCQ